MSKRPLQLAVFVVVFAAIGLALPMQASASGFNARMSTFAGSGAIGYHDGDAAAATFVLPVGIAVGPDGAVYVADAGSQRIRVIRNSRVVTLAGSGDFLERGFWVHGGYRNGPGAQAQFNFPAALAVDAKGVVYVADADNHCIRTIAPDGTVSTFSGSPGQTSEVNGPRATAGFHRPMGIALDSKGDVYVADQGVGMRKIAADGTVSTVFPDPGLTGVTISADDRTLLGSNMTAGFSYQIDGSGYQLDGPGTLLPAAGPHLGDLADIGHPFAATMIDWHRAIYSDAKTGAIRYVDLYLGTNKFLIGDRGSDATNDAAGFRDGPLDVAKASDPLGVALAPSGTLYVADAGNRRIRSIPRLNFREATIVAVDALPPEISNAASKNVIVTGNSFVWANCVWDDSWEGLLEQRLRAAGDNFTIYPVLIGTPPVSVMFDYIKGTLSTMPHVDRVIFLMNYGVVNTSGPDWRKAYVSGLRQVRDALAKSGIQFSVVVQPTPYDFDWQQLPVIRYLANDSSLCVPNENSMGGQYSADTTRCLLRNTASSPFYQEMLDATRESGVSYRDLAPYFIEDARRAATQPLFGTSEGHQTDHGRGIMADAMFDSLTRAATSPSPRP